MNLAILVGVSEYDHCDNLPACDNDLKVMNKTLHKLNKFEEICVLPDSPKAIEVKQQITDFVNKYKGNKINELVFYFTGHGARFDDDFFYVCSDFLETRKEVTGFRNSELDGLIRNLSPDLTLKIVDACYSGETYVKSSTDIKPIFEKSASENKLKDLYFFHSSNSKEESLAFEDFSAFSLSFFKSLTQRTGSMRYRDIMAFIADEMSNLNFPKPTFIVQASNTEIFGEIDKDLISFLETELKLTDTTTSVMSQASNTENESSVKSLSLVELVQKTNNQEYCSSEEGLANIILIQEIINSDLWKDGISEIFNIESTELEYSIPNEKSIAQWLEKQDDESYFVESTYRSVSYKVQEYKKAPRNPSRFSGLSLLGAYDDYNLETIEKTKQVLDGITFTATPPFEALRVNFEPKFNSVENYALTIVPIFSRKTLVIFYAFETLEYLSWDDFSEVKCGEWKAKKSKLKDSDKITEISKNIIEMTSEFILNDIQSKLETK